MTLAEVIALINSDIVPNGNNEITANVLRPILIEMLQQPNDLIGDLGDLNTVESDTLVDAINSVNNALSNVDGFVILSGQGDPNGQTFPSLSIADLYSEIDGLGSPLALWIYDGTKFIRLSDKYLSYEIPQSLTPIEKLTARSNIGATDRRLEELVSDLTANEREIIKAKLGITNGGGEIRNGDVISGMPIATASLLELSFLDLYSNKYVAPTNANVGNRICVKMAGADFGYTNGVIDIEDLSAADKVEINDNLGNGICIAVLIFDESNGTVEQTEVLSPYGVYLHMANNPGERAIRIGNFFRESGRLFFDVNPGII